MHYAASSSDDEDELPSEELVEPNIGGAKKSRSMGCRSSSKGSRGSGLALLDFCTAAQVLQHPHDYQEEVHRG
jgi:hypothetical protein